MRTGSKLFEDDMELQKELEAAALEAEAVSQGAKGTNLPGVTRVNIEPEVVAPPAREVISPKVVQVPGRADEDLEMAYADAQDREARRRMAFERGARELVAGLTRSEAPPIISQPGDAVAKLLASRKARDEREQQRAALGLQGQKMRAEAERNMAMDQRHQTEREQDLQQRDVANKRAEQAHIDSMAHTKALESLAYAGNARAETEAAEKAKERAAKESANAIPVFGGTLQLTEGLGDAERSKARDTAGLWNAADQSVANFQANLEEFARNPSVENKGKVTAALRTASSAFNTAIGGGAMSQDEAKAMSQAMGADVLAPEGIAAFMQSVLGDDTKAAQTISTRVRAAREANRTAALGRLGVYGKFSGAQAAPESAPKRQRFQNDAGDVIEWDGSQWVKVK